jgi:hypothetical protein
VPFGGLVGDHSFATLDAFYQGYGEVAAFGGFAPDQSRISAAGGDAYLAAGFPKLDYIRACTLAWQSNWTKAAAATAGSAAAAPARAADAAVAAVSDASAAAAAAAVAALRDLAPPPPRPLPRYHPTLAWPPPLGSDRERTFFWWLAPLKVEIERLQAESLAEGKAPSSAEAWRHVLRPSDVHTVRTEVLCRGSLTQYAQFREPNI